MYQALVSVSYPIVHIILYCTKLFLKYEIYPKVNEINSPNGLGVATNKHTNEVLQLAKLQND